MTFSAETGSENLTTKPEVLKRALTMSESSRAKSTYRVAFESEKSVILQDIGDLEQIRARIGVSRRKMCQILMVDPSAWTRWTRSAEGAPPHVYRMLEWYLLLKEKHPTLAHQYYERLSKPVTAEGENLLRQELQHQLKSTQSRLSSQLSSEVEQLQRELSNLRQRFPEKSPGSEFPSDDTRKIARTTILAGPMLWGASGFLLGLAAWALGTFLFRAMSK